MALCTNQSGTWRNITTLCVNQSGTWRSINIGCINQSSVWRRFLPPIVTRVSLGAAVEGGRLICRASNLAWIVAPNTAEVSRNWYQASGAVTRAQEVSGCSGWFIPSIAQRQNPGFTCKVYWDTYGNSYWTSHQGGNRRGHAFYMHSGYSGEVHKNSVLCARAFRCVTY